MPGHEEALAASARIAEMVEPNYESLGLGKRCFPSFQPPDNLTTEEYLRSSASWVCKTVMATIPPPRRGASGPRTEHHQSDGVCVLLPDRVGLRALCA